MFVPSGGQAGNKDVLKRNLADDICCNDYPSACKFELTIPSAATVNSLKIKRKEDSAEITLNIGVSGAANVAAKMRDEILAQNYFDDGVDLPGVSYTTAGGNVIYSIVGALIVVSATHSGSTVVNAVKKCKRVGICDFKLTIPGGATNNFSVDGVVVNLGAINHATDSAATVQGLFQNASNFPAGYTVTVVKTATAFDVTIKGPGGKEFAVNGVRFAQSNCVIDYIA